MKWDVNPSKCKLKNGITAHLSIKIMNKSWVFSHTKSKVWGGSNKLKFMKTKNLFILFPSWEFSKVSLAILKIGLVFWLKKSSL